MFRRSGVPANRPLVGTHLSSNLESLAGGIKTRPLGFSVARRPSELLSSPSLSEPRGTPGLLQLGIRGRGLDYSIPEHAKLVDGLIENAYTMRARGDARGVDTIVVDALRNLGFSWVNNFNGVGMGLELHLLRPKSAEILKSIPLGDRPKAELIRAAREAARNLKMPQRGQEIPILLFRNPEL